MTLRREDSDLKLTARTRNMTQRVVSVSLGNYAFLKGIFRIRCNKRHGPMPG